MSTLQLGNNSHHNEKINQQHRIVSLFTDDPIYFGFIQSLSGVKYVKESSRS